MSSPRDPTQFTRESAERIANVVRAAELSSPGAKPLSFERADFFKQSKVFRVCTFTGAWPTGVEKVVTFKYQTATPNTASAMNLFYPIAKTAAAGDCAIAKDGTAWFLIDVPFETATAVFVGSTSSSTVFGTGSTSVIRFMGTGSTSQATYITGVSASLNTANCTISITAATATATTVSMAGTQTAISVSMAGTQTITVAGATFTSTFLRFRV
jgi:hypothetical protein